MPNADGVFKQTAGSPQRQQLKHTPGTAWWWDRTPHREQPLSVPKWHDDTMTMSAVWIRTVSLACKG